MKAIPLTETERQVAAFAKQQLITDPGRSSSVFAHHWDALACVSHANAVDKGFWPKEGRSDGDMIALEHSELSEALEGIRKGNPPSSKIPEFTAAEEEYADVIIRIMDHSKARGWRVAEAVEAKMRYNFNREHKHGKAF